MTPDTIWCWTESLESSIAGGTVYKSVLGGKGSSRLHTPRCPPLPSLGHQEKKADGSKTHVSTSVSSTPSPQTKLPASCPQAFCCSTSFHGPDQLACGFGIARVRKKVKMIETVEQIVTAEAVAWCRRPLVRVSADISWTLGTSLKPWRQP